MNKFETTVFERLTQATTLSSIFFFWISNYSDDFNFSSASYLTVFLERKFNALLEEGMHFVNIWGKGSHLVI